MKILKILLMVSVMSLLSACGGSGSSQDTVQIGTDEGNTGTDRKMIFEYASSPLHPRAFNLGAITAGQENEFKPGDTISLVWNMGIYYSDNTTIGADVIYLYDSEVYISSDDILQTDVDLNLFSVECSLPMMSEHACGEFASFQCVYAEDNLNNISCSSIPLNRELGITDHTVDTTPFIDAIPKIANLIFRSCLRAIPEQCVEAVYPIQLN